MTPRQLAQKILDNRSLWEGQESFLEIVGNEIAMAIEEARSEFLATKLRNPPELPDADGAD